MDMGDELARKGRWVALINQETGQGRRVRLYVKIKPLLGCLTGLLVMGYLASALALFVWLDRNPFNKVGYLDVAMPWRWSTLNTLRGEGFSEQGAVELENGEAARALFYLRRGLSLNPDNEPTRLALAGYYARANYYPGVERTVRPQLKFGYSRALVELLIKQAAAADDTDTILEVVDEMQRVAGIDVAETEWLTAWRARTLIETGESVEALRVVEESSYTGSNWDLLKVDALVAGGHLDEALAVAKAMPPALSGMLPLALRAQAKVRSERREREALLAVLEEIFRENRQVAESWIYGIEQLVKAGLMEDAEEFIDGFMRRFGARVDTVNSMVGRVLNLGKSTGSQLVLQRISAWQEPTPVQRVFLVWSLIREAQWEELEEVVSDGVGDEIMDEFLQPFVRVLGEATKDTSATGALEAWLGRDGLSLMTYRSLIEGLGKDELWPLVKIVAVAGQRYHPRSSKLTRFLAEAEEKLSEIKTDSRISEAVEAVRKTYEESEVEDLRQKVVGLVKDTEWSQVERLVLQVRRQRAGWLNRIEPELDEADAEAGAARDDWERLARLAPAILRRDPGRMAWFLDQAERAIGLGETKRALRLVGQIKSVEQADDRAEQLWQKLTALLEGIKESELVEGADYLPIAEPQP